MTTWEDKRVEVIPPLHPDEQVMHIMRFEGVPARVIRALPTNSAFDGPNYEIEWPDGKREIVGRNSLTTEFSFGPSTSTEE